MKENSERKCLEVSGAEINETSMAKSNNGVMAGVKRKYQLVMKA
jgi:hypothetical protein